MTDYRTRNRGSSIFSDDDRGENRWRGEQPRGERWRSADYGWGGNPGRGAEPRRETSEDRGFLEKAGDEVRSWFGDDEAERRRERDARETASDGQRDDEARLTRRTGRQDEARHEGGRLRSNQAEQPTSAGADDEPGGFGDGGFGGTRQARSGGGDPRFASHHDESYRRWRDEQIAALDRDYDEYRRQRQQQFDQEFSSFRQNRQSQITSGGATLSQTGAEQTAQVSARPATGASAQPGAGELTTGTETVTAEPASESESRSARNR